MKNILEAMREELLSVSPPRSGHFSLWVDVDGNVQWGIYHDSFQPASFVRFKELLCSVDFTSADWGHGHEDDEDYVSPEKHWEVYVEYTLMPQVEDAIFAYQSQMDMPSPGL